jgi:hypothetical protein
MKLSSKDFDRIRGWLQCSLQEHGGPRLDDYAVQCVVNEMQRDWRPEYGMLGIEPPTIPATEPPPADEIEPLPRGVEYVLVESTHSRTAGMAQHSFVGVVPMVRFDLPKTQQHVLADTTIGTVVDGDVKLYCLDVVNDYYRERMGFDAERVELLTPLRVMGARFAPILVGLMYRHASDPEPSAFYMAGGMANGPTRVLYSSKTMAPIRGRAGYQPTPFSSIDNWYEGSVRVGPDGHVEHISISITAPGGDKPHFTIDAVVKRVPNHLLAAIKSNPYALLLQAALRVCAIADAMGRQVPDLGPLTSVLAPLGRNYEWIKPPTKGT